ncbi:MAG: cupin domain-containing protein [Bdellovibrionales bacterium]|nr:cupin domain-containing protein [Bdellovibrionales bacterium]
MISQKNEVLKNYILNTFISAKKKEFLESKFPGQITDYFSIDQFKEILGSYNLKKRELIVLDKRPVNNFLSQDFHSEESFSENGILDFCHQKRLTIRLNNVWKYSEDLKIIRSELKKSLQGELSINAYYSPENADSFSFHYDSCDSLAFGISGEKRMCFIFEQEDQITPKFSFHDLKENAVLYVPRGLIHKAKVQSDHSLHIVFVWDPEKNFSNYWYLDDEISLKLK